MLNIKQTLCVLALVAVPMQVVRAEPAKLPPITNGMTVLLDASDINADGSVDTGPIGLVNNGGVKGWTNKSTLNGGSAIAENNFFSDGGGFPKRLPSQLNGKATIGFKKGGFVASSIKLIPANNNYTKFVVFKIDDIFHGNNLISSDSTALWLGAAVSADKPGVLKSLHTGVNYLTDKNNKVLGTKDYHIASTRYANGLPATTPALLNVLRLDGKEVASNALPQPFANSATYIGIGDVDRTAEFLLDGEIAEVIIYNRALTNKEIDDVEKYLEDKWGGFKENKITSFIIAAGKKEKGKSFKLSGASSSKLPVIFESATPSICKVGGTAFNQLKLLAVGTCIVDAGVDGNKIFRDAEAKRKSFVVESVAATSVPTTNSTTTNSTTTNSTTTSKSSGGSVPAILMVLLGLLIAPRLYRHQVLIKH